MAKTDLQGIFNSDINRVIVKIDKYRIMKINFEKEIEINLYEIIEDWLSDMDIKPPKISHSDADDLAERIKSTINKSLNIE